MWRIWTVVPKWKAVLSLVILNAALLWLYYHEDEKRNPDFVLYGAPGEMVGVSPIIEDERDANRAFLKFYMPLDRVNGKPILDRPQAWINTQVTIFTVEFLHPQSDAAIALNCTPCSKTYTLPRNCVPCPNTIVNNVSLRYAPPPNRFKPLPRPNMSITYFSADGAARTGTKDWNITPFTNLWEPEPETDVRRLRYMIAIGEDWVRGGFGFEILYRNGGSVEDGGGNLVVGNGPEILGLDMGWWGMNPYHRFETADNDELRANLEGWRGVKERWVLYMVGKGGARSWGPLEYRENWWKKYGSHYGGVKGW